MENEEDGEGKVRKLERGKRTQENEEKEKEGDQMNIIEMKSLFDSLIFSSVVKEEWFFVNYPNTSI